ncbi:hypothetical protein QTN25_004098 [Entamoeba marina]
MPAAGILKRLKKFGKTVGNVLADVNDNIYKPLKPAIEGAINTIPMGEYINRGLEYGSNMLDTYVPYKQGKVKGNNLKKQLKYSGYYEDDEDFDNRNDFRRYYN